MSGARDGAPPRLREDIEELRERAVVALRQGRFDLAEDLLASGDVSLAALVENLRIYQAELEIQNEELIASQRASERALARFTTLFTALPIAALVADRHGLVIDANPEATELFGLRNLSAHHHFLVRLVDEQDRGAVMHQWTLLRGDQDPTTELTEVRLRSSDGRPFIGDLHVARLPDSGDGEPRFICAVIDRTEAVRQRTELQTAYDRLGQSQEAYRVLADFGPDFDYWVGPEGRFIHVSPGCEPLTGYRAEDFLDDPTLFQQLVHPDDRDCWHAHNHQESSPEALDESLLTFRLRHRDGGLRWVEHVCAPVVSEDGRFLGRRGVNRDVTRRHQAEDALGDLRALLIEAERIANVGGWGLDLTTNRVQVSPQWMRIHGSAVAEMSLEELIARHAHPGDMARIEAAFRAAIAGTGSYDLTHRIRRADDGQERVVHARGELVRAADGTPLKLRGAALDITREVAADRALRESEARFRSIFDAAPLGIAVLDANGSPVMANPALERFLGWGRDELRCMTFADYTHPDDRAADAEAFRGLVAGEQRSYTREKRYLRKDGALVWGRVTVAMIPNVPEAPSFSVALIADISEQRAAEQALRESEQRYRTLFESAGEGLGIIQDDRFVSVNHAALAMLGTDDAGYLLHRLPHEISPETQPDGQPSTIKERTLLDRAYAGATQRFEWEHRRADGASLAVEVTLIPVQLEAGGALFVTWHDLGPERAARERERRARTVFENTSEGIVVTDPEQRILAVNRAFTEITGYTEEEALGKTPRLLKSGRHDAAFYQSMWASLAATGQWRGEFWNRRHNGDLYPQRSTISAVHDDQGRLTNYVGVFGDVTQLKRSEETLYRLAHHDALTGLPNRVLLRARVEQSIRRASRDGGMLALLFLDLDLFKNVNDSLGHPVGDRLLQQVAMAMSREVRTGDSIARLGGDEFVVLMEDVEDPNLAAGLARRLLGTLSRPFQVESRELYISASIGISVFPLDGQDMDSLLSNADVAMYQAKEQGRNTYRFFEPAMTEGAMARLRLENALRGALARGELTLKYQPQFRLSDRCIHGAEVLLRWHHPDLGEVGPTQFIPVAEEIGLIGELGAWVLEQSCRQLAAWDAAGFLVPRLAVNLSVQQLEQPDLIARVRGILARTGVEADRLELEVTETVLMRHADRVIATLDALRAMGITLAVDDFGAGFSSFAYLKRLPISRLKIDRLFIERLTEDPSDDAITRAIIALGRGLGLEVLAEGVETEAQADFLAREGCTEAQGFLFGRPMAPSAVISHEGWRAAIPEPRG